MASHHPIDASWSPLSLVPRPFFSIRAEGENKFSTFRSVREIWPGDEASHLSD